MKLALFFTSLFAALPLFVVGIANAAEPVKDTGAMACFTDKWDTKEPEKGHKLVDYAGRCVLIPDDPAEPTISQDCTGKYEYMPDESWKGSGNLHRQLSRRQNLPDLGRGLAAQGIHLHQDWRHREIRRRQRWRYVHVPKRVRHALRWQIQRDNPATVTLNPCRPGPCTQPPMVTGAEEVAGLAHGAPGQAKDGFYIIGRPALFCAAGGGSDGTYNPAPDCVSVVLTS